MPGLSGFTRQNRERHPSCSAVGRTEGLSLVKMTLEVWGIANIDCSIDADRCAWFSRLSSGSGHTCCQYDSVRSQVFSRCGELMKVFAHSSVLDEITTHIDSPTLQALGRALRSYPGSLVLVTHDR